MTSVYVLCLLVNDGHQVLGAYPSLEAAQTAAATHALGTHGRWLPSYDDDHGDVGNDWETATSVTDIEGGRGTWEITCHAIVVA